MFPALIFPPTQVQGGILNFEVLRPDGSVFSYKTFEREAAAAGFHVRTGAECNPGACYNYLGVQVGVGTLS
jgi:molybdenum cofactor sulfurtransferase